MYITSHIIKKYKLLLGMLCILHSMYAQQAPKKDVNVGQERLRKVRSMSFDREKKRQQSNLNIDPRTLTEIEEQNTSNRFTQTEAYFQIPSLREMVTNTFQVVPYMNIVSRIMSNEARMR